MRLFSPLPVLLALALPAAGAEPDEIDRLWRLMQMDEVIAVMREEGLDYGRDLDTDMLDSQGGPGFAGLIDGIYDTARMTSISRREFHEALAEADISAATAFFEGELGARVIGLELAARQALLDPAVEEASHERVAEMEADGTPRLEQLVRFAEVNDLVESNVMGALNSSYAFYLGLRDGGALDGSMGEGEILAEVWSQEDAVRTDTEEWVYGFLSLAYQPLADDELDAYTAFSRTAEGQELNRAIFLAFDEMFLDISHALGTAVAQYSASEEL